MALSFGIRSSALPYHAKVAAFRGSEGLSRPYVFDIYVNVAGEDDLDLADGVGAKAMLTIDGAGGAPVYVNGMIASLQLLRAITGNALYRVRIVPTLWQLSLTKHSRMFTKVSAPDVIKAVLALEGVDDFELRLNGHYEIEEHICQYKESSLAFIQRWMEREGMYYFFEQTDSGEKLVIADDKATHELSPGVLAVPYRPSDGDHSAGKHFDYFAARHDALPASVTLTDYDYNRPQLDITGSADVSATGLGEVRNYGNRTFAPAAGAHLAKVRAEELRAKGTTYHATGALAGLSPGFKFFVEQHPKLSLNKEYLTTSIEHFGFVADVASSWGKIVPHDHDEVYRVDLQALDAEQQYRHPETSPWPRIDGFENGNVDGPATSEYAQIDSHGRYNVKFKFDEGSLKEGKATTFVRMLQPHGGSPEGFHFPLRKSTEVLVAFLGGDPDMPVIIGVVPNAVTPSKVTSSNHTQNMIHTGGNNYITLEDQAGSQFVNIFSPILASNLYLGQNRPAGGHGPTSPSAPAVSPIGEYKQSLGAFNFDLRTSGSGEISAAKNVEVIAGAKLQLEGQGGVYQYAGVEHHVHVNGPTEEHRSGKVHHRWDAEVDLDWKGDYTLDVQKNSVITYVGELKQDTTQKVEIFNHATLGVTTDGATTVSDKTSLTHFIGSEAGAGGATHFLNVEGTQTVHVTDKQTVNVDAEQEWTTGTNVDWKIGGKLDIVVTGPHSIESATWHENTWGKKSEFIGGWQNGIVLGLKTDTTVGVATDIKCALMADITIGLKFEFAAGVRIGVEGAMELAEAPLKHTGAASKLDTVATWIGCKGLSILSGLKII